MRHKKRAQRKQNDRRKIKRKHEKNTRISIDKKFSVNAFRFDVYQKHNRASICGIQTTNKATTTAAASTVRSNKKKRKSENRSLKGKLVKNNFIT